MKQGMNAEMEAFPVDFKLILANLFCVLGCLAKRAEVALAARLNLLRREELI